MLKKTIKVIASYLRGDDYASSTIKHKIKIDLTSLAHALHSAQGHVVRPIIPPPSAVAESIIDTPQVSTAHPVVAAGTQAYPPKQPDTIIAAGNASEIPASPPVPTTAEPGPFLETPAFIREIIEPYSDLLEKAEALEGIYHIINMLDKEGGCPSISAGSDGVSGTDYASVKDILGKVSLRSHTYRVVRHAIEMVKATYGDKPGQLPTIIVAALGHDLGMLPSYRIKEEHLSQEHPVISAAIVKDIFGIPHDDSVLNSPHAWLNMAVKMIHEHHQISSTAIVSLLREADGKAREDEIIQETGIYKNPAWKDWFDAKHFLNRYIRMEINAIQEQKWKAFSFDGLVYCLPDFLYEAAKQYASDSKVVSMYLFRSMDKNIAIKLILGSLRRIGAIGAELGPTEMQKKYKIVFNMNKMVFKTLIPIKEEAFEKGEIDDLREAKEGLSHQITDVEVA